MEIAAPIAAPVQPIKKVVKPKSVKPKASGGKYFEMITQAISKLAERGGSSRQAILKFICANFPIEPKQAAIHLKMALKHGVKSGSLKQSKGVGASGSFKLGEKKVEKKPKVKKAPKIKKPKVKKAIKKPKIVKKTVVKKIVKKAGEKKIVKKPKLAKLAPVEAVVAPVIAEKPLKKVLKTVKPKTVKPKTTIKPKKIVAKKEAKPKKVVKAPKEKKPKAAKPKKEKKVKAIPAPTA